MSAEQRIQELGIELPPPPPPGGVYKPVVIVGDLAYVSGHGPWQKAGAFMAGRIGKEMNLEKGMTAAHQTGLAMLATLKAELGSLDRIRRVIKILGMVNCTPDFESHPAVINGFSELMRDVFGEDNGVGARSAVGMGSLPGNIPVEVEAIFELNS